MKFLKYFFQYIKSIIKSKENKMEESNLEQLSKQEEIVEDYEYLYNQIKVGDIIWAKRYQNEIEKESFPSGHREGPFIVIKKENGKLISIEGTSVVPYEKYIDMNFYLNNEGYKLNKETYFKLNKLHFINKYSFIKCMDKLNEIDKNRLFRHIKLSPKVYYTEKNKTMDFNFPIQVGDIINYNNQSFITLDANDENIILVIIKNNLNYKEKANLDFNNFKDIDFSNSICLKISTDIRYVNSVSNKCIESILKKFQEYINNCKNVEITQRGTIISKDNKFYYIYGEEGQEWLAFEISTNGVNGFQKIEIGHHKYYTKYKDLKINKKDKFVNIYLCSDDDKDRIKLLRKKYKEQEKNKVLYSSIEGYNFKIGNIIENINYKNRRYIIIGIHKKTCECISIEKLKKAIYDPILLRKTECRLSKDFSLSEIKWFDEHKDFDLKKITNKETMNDILKRQIEYLKNQHVESQTINNEFSTIRINSIVKTNEFSEETFVVKKILGDTLVCTSSADYKKQNPIKQYLNKNNVIIVEGIQKKKVDLQNSSFFLFNKFYNN